MKNLKLRQGKVAIMSVTIFILMFTMVFSLDIPEYSEEVSKYESNFLLRDVQASADSSSFISVWNTTLTSSGSSGTNQVKLPLESRGFYDFTVNWGDSNSDTITNWDQTEVTHTYSSTGVYEVNITGTIAGWRFNNGGDKLKLVEISQWGNLRLGYSGSYFAGCTNLKLTTTDILNLTGTTSLRSTFEGCATIGSNGNLGGWDVSGVTIMNSMFSEANTFNQDIGGWNVSSVARMDGMFDGATAFNQDIGGWDVSSVIDMSSMFSEATAFNQDIGGWDVSGVIGTFYMTVRVTPTIIAMLRWKASGMSNMFYGATAFNQDIGGWNVSAVTGMNNMFYGATAFNQDIGGWDVSRVINMSSMFYGATAFNQDVGEWDVSRVTDMSAMFSGAMTFNQDIGGWNVSSVADMNGMFFGATTFNQDIGRWNISGVRYLVATWNVSVVSGVKYMGNMFFEATAFNQDIGGWDVSSVTDMNRMFYEATAFNQDIGGWDVSNVTSMENMFFDVTLATDNYDSLLIGWANLTLQSGVIFSAGNSQYSSAAAIARQFIIDTFGWTIDDNGLIGNEGETPTIPGYNFALIPTILLGLVILTLKIRIKKNEDS